MSTLQTVAIFFKYLPKRQRQLEQFTEEINIGGKRGFLKEVGVGKVKVLGETRCVERHTTLEEFRKIYEAILDCLTAISKNIFISIRQHQHAEYSEVCKMTEETVNIAETVISISREANREKQRTISPPPNILATLTFPTISTPPSPGI